MANLILIHGSWHGAWCWFKIARRLRAAGHHVAVPDLPYHAKALAGADARDYTDATLDAYVDVLVDCLRDMRDQTHVIAHSRGGIVASALAERVPEQIASSIYVAAYLLPEGARVVDYALQDGDSLAVPNVSSNFEQGWDMLDEDYFDAALYGDCSKDDIALCHALLTPEPLTPALTKLSLSRDRYGQVPRGYIMLTEDLAVSPKLQRRMLDESPCQVVHELDASHSAYFSRPDELTELILKSIHALSPPKE